MDSPSPNDPLLADLTPAQAQAVTAVEGPVLVLAAAGSGKTRVLTRRVAQLLRLGAPPWSILALTFTNKAAGEMRDRVAKLLAGGLERADGSPLFFSERAIRSVTLTTFHSLCARLLRRYAEQAASVLPVRPDFTIYDDADQVSLIKKSLEELQLSSSSWPPRGVLGTISGAKNQLQDAAAFERDAHDFYSRTASKIFSRYEAGLRKANAVDFDDLLVLTARMLRHVPAVRDELHARYRHVMIDEYQDTNHAQLELARLLVGTPDEPGQGPKGPNIFVVGDPDQSIYGWRGADINNILDFEKHYPAARVIKLGENFRSTAPILAAADGLIKHNAIRKDKPLFTAKPGGDRIEVTLTRSEQHEALLVADWLHALHMGTHPGESRDAIAWKDMAVFYRTNSLSRVLEDALRQGGIPYTIARGTAFFDREEIKTAVAFLRLVANPADSVSLRRIINTPARGISDSSVRSLEQHAASHDCTLWEACLEPSESMGINARAVQAIRKFVDLVESWTGGGSFMGAQVPASLATLVERILAESGLRDMYARQAAASKSEADSDRVDNLDELISSARSFELEYDPAGDPAFSSPAPTHSTPDTSFAPDFLAQGDDAMPITSDPPLLSMLRGYLEGITLMADADSVDPEQGAVTMMTLHAAKGLEFPAVAIIGLEEGLLPHSRALTDDKQMEEERRLCFVGITRAMRRLHLTAAKYRTQRGLAERTIPSRFLEELPEHTRSVSDQADAFQGLDSSWGGARDNADLRGDDFGDRRQPSSSRPGSFAASHAPSQGRRIVPVEQAFDRTPQPSPPRPQGNPLAPKPPASDPYPVGTMVRHPQFGRGKVISTTRGTNARAVILFDGIGTKTLVLEFARLTRIN